jgi:hypothetical protein
VARFQFGWDKMNFTNQNAPKKNPIVAPNLMNAQTL